MQSSAGCGAVALVSALWRVHHPHRKLRLWRQRAAAFDWPTDDGSQQYEQRRQLRSLWFAYTDRQMRSSSLKSAGAG